MRSFWIWICVALAPIAAWAQLDRGGNVLNEDDGGGSGRLTPGSLAGFVVLVALTWGIYKYLERTTGNSSAANFNIAFFSALAVAALVSLVFR